MFDYDAELIRYQPWLREAADVSIGDRVLDIGCGTGQSTREAARAAGSGSATGIDVSESAIDRARLLADEAALHNVSFVCADAQTHPFAPERFTVGISRFGTMFFADPVAGFANIASALRPGARLVQLVWQAAARQEWVDAIRNAVAGSGRTPLGQGGAAFSLADPSDAAGLLTTAGFSAVEIVDVREPICYGKDAAGARDALVDLGMVEKLVADLDVAERAHAHDRLLTLLESHDTGDGVWFDSRVWLISARRP